MDSISVYSQCYVDTAVDNERNSIWTRDFKNSLGPVDEIACQDLLLAVLDNSGPVFHRLAHLIQESGVFRNHGGVCDQVEEDIEFH